MLFLGTEKYPGEEEYEQFLRQYGGFGNAWIDMEDTSYYFSITTEKDKDSETNGKASPGLHGALDRLAQFFIAPRFDADATDREVKAIDSEYRNGKTSDAWRNYQFLKSISNQKHPFAKFGCGNAETLSSRGMQTLLSELRNFWTEHYQTHCMRLSVAGHASLDALQSSVEDTFGGLPYSKPRLSRRVQNNAEQFFQREHAVYRGAEKQIVESTESTSTLPAFGPDQLSVLHRVRPLTETRMIKVHFAIPPLHDPVLTRGGRPHRVVSHILGHESPGSLHALLNAKGYITGLSTGTAIDTSDFGLFGINLQAE